MSRVDRAGKVYLVNHDAERKAEWHPYPGVPCCLLLDTSFWSVILLVDGRL